MSRPPYTPAQTLPHGPSMCLLDEILACDAESSTCALRITPASRFYEPGLGAPSWVGIEYMAQCIGVWAGVQRLQAGLPVTLGLLLGTRSYACTQAHFAEGQRVVVTARLLVRDSQGVGVFACELGNGTDVWAQADIKAFQPDDIKDFLAMLSGEDA